MIHRRVFKKLFLDFELLYTSIKFCIESYGRTIFYESGE